MKGLSKLPSCCGQDVTLTKEQPVINSPTAGLLHNAPHSDENSERTTSTYTSQLQCGELQKLIGIHNGGQRAEIS